MLIAQWKSDERLYSHLQASVQGIERNSSRSTAYSDTMQLMVSAGVCAIDGYHRGTTQLIQLDVECTGNPKIKMFHVPPTKQKVTLAGKKMHMQFNCMYVCTLKVANDHHGLTAQPTNAGFVDFGFLDRAEVDRGGGGEGGGGGGRSGGGAPYPSDSR